MIRILVLKISIIGLIYAVNQETWEKYKSNHHKTYLSAKHESKARAIYEHWDAKIQDHNIRYYAGKETYKMGHNQFSDLTSEEFMNLPGLNTFGFPYRPATPAKDDPKFKIPDNWKPTSTDKRTCKIPVRDQKKCGSCWAFTAVAVIERYLLDKYGITANLSTQNLVDCAVDWGGCEGGFMEAGYKYFMDKGLDFEKIYPYNVTDNRCQFRPIIDSYFGISKKYAPNDYYMIGKNETKWAWSVENIGWMSVKVAVGGWQFYQKGIFKASDCSGPVSHAVTIVGYETDPDTKIDYWIIRNSWGEDWGDHGYMYLERNNKACKIQTPIYLR